MRSPCTARKFVPLPTSRSRWSRTSPLKPSSPSRTRGCSTNCGNRWSSRRRRRRCCKSSQAHPAILSTVFATMLENATRICEAKFGALYLSEGDGFRATAMHNAPPAYEEARAGVLHPPPSTSLWRAANTKQAVQIADVRLERGYIERDPFVVSAVALGGYRSVLSVPMLHEDELLALSRSSVKKFAHSPTSRFRWSKTSPPRPSSPSRTRGCSTNCDNRWSSKPLPPRCFRSSSALPATLSRSLPQCWRRQSAFATLSSACSIFAEADTLRLISTRNVPPAFADAQRKGPFRPAYRHGMLDRRDENGPRGSSRRSGGDAVLS